MYCIFDTETSGLFDFSRPADAEGQPRLASIAMLAADDDLKLTAATAVLVRPDGWVMPPEAEHINGLGTEFLAAYGVPVVEVLKRYSMEAQGCVMVAHNAPYDTKIMRGELRRAGLPDLAQETRTICTMQALTDRCGIPSRNGRGFKWPKLAEAVEIILGRSHRDAHGALPDAMACLDLLRWMKTNGCLPEPRTLLAA